MKRVAKHIIAKGKQAAKLTAVQIIQTSREVHNMKRMLLSLSLKLSPWYLLTFRLIIINSPVYEGV